MAGFNGNKAAPFTKGGGRDASHANDGKGRTRKQAMAKAIVRKAGKR